MSDENNEDFINQEEYDALSEEERLDFVIAEKVTASDYEKEYQKRYYTPATGTRGEKKQKVAAAKRLARRGRQSLLHDPYTIGAGPKGKLPEEFITQEEYDDLSVEEQQEYELVSEVLDGTMKKIGYAFKGRMDAQKASKAGDKERVERRKRGKDLLVRSIERDKQRYAKQRNEEYDLDESVASDTLKPASRSVDDPKSKIEVMQRTLGAMNSMNKGDLTKWYTQAMALIGKEASSLPAGANSDANQSSVDMKTGKGPKTRDPMPKLSVREDVEEMFDGEELSEEFRDKATTLFEAAVNARLTVEVAKLEEEFEARLDEELEAIAEEAVNNLDTYLGYVVERWMEENRVAIESTLRSEITEEFIDGLKNLFTEHYIDVPSDKVDVVESLTVKVQELEEQLHEAISVNRELSEAVLEAERQEVFEELSESLTLAQSEKFAALAEGIEFDGDLDVYRTKLSVVKEKYFAPKTHSSNIEEETFEGETLTESTVSVDPSVNRYVQAISRTVKK